MQRRIIIFYLQSLPFSVITDVELSLLPKEQRRESNSRSNLILRRTRDHCANATFVFNV